MIQSTVDDAVWPYAVQTPFKAITFHLYHSDARTRINRGGKVNHFYLLCWALRRYTV